MFEFAPPTNSPGSVKRAETKVPGARPELLDRLPPSLITSPPIWAVGGVFVLLYGIVLFAVVSDRRHKAEADAKAAREALAAVVKTPTHAILPPVPEPTTPSKASEKKRSPKPASPVASNSAEPSPKTTPKPSRSRSTAKTRKARPSTPVAAEPVKPIPVRVSKLEAWGVLSGYSGDCGFQVEDAVFTIDIPGTLHVLSPELKVRNSPKLLTEARGDFTAEVKVLGRILPGTQPLPKLPFTYQGAGLLIWEDENNYLRLERCSSFFTQEKKRLHQVMIELCRDGRTIPALARDVREADLTLRMDRRGSEVRCSYSPDDGKTWLEIKRQTVPFPAAVKVGVSASSASPKPFVAKLEGFGISGPGAKTASSAVTDRP